MSLQTPAPLSHVQQLCLVALRFAIGWHMYVQGYGKLTRPGWSAAPYLDHASGPLAAPFRALAARPALLTLCDLAIPWVLLALGLLLMLGLATRSSTVAAILLMASFVIAQPPLLTGGILVVGGDGHAELYVNQTVLETLALAVTLSFDTGRLAGLDAFLRGRRSKALAAASSSSEKQS